MGVACPACGAAGSVEAGRSGAYRLLVCGNCTLGFCDPMRAADEAWYGGEGNYAETLGSDAAETLRHVYADRLDTEGGEAVWLGPNHLAFLAELPGRNGRLLDVGCGEGTFLAQAAPHYASAEGIELDSHAASRAAALPGVRVRRARIEDLAAEHETEAYDVVTLFEVLEHIEDPLAALVACSRVLRPDGTLVLSVPHKLRPGADEDPSDLPPNHLTRWTERALRTALDQAGFDVLRLHARKRSRYGFREAGWLVTSRFPHLLERLGATGNVRRAMFLRSASGVLWIGLWPWYALTGKPTYGLYAEARPR